MAEITAAAVKELRDKTGLPMMECKKALVEAEGDQETAIANLRKQGLKTQATRADRETGEGRIAIYTDGGVGAMIELQCESGPVASNEDFVQLCADLAKQLATGPGAATPDELLDQQSPSAEGQTLREQKDDLYNRIRETFNLARILRIDSTCGGYVHHAGKVVGVLAELEGENPEVAKDVCMHIAAMNPDAVNVEDLPDELVAKEREILTEAARKEGKPDNVIEKMIDGRMRKFYAERVLNEQPFVKDDKQTVGKYASAGGIKVKRFEYWQLGKES
ncbi:MAG: translation elongation factor Ts [Pirellulales bacterium]|nr:translation elongation factor Ts [Pirellulales bacterium]